MSAKPSISNSKSIPSTPIPIISPIKTSCTNTATKFVKVGVVQASPIILDRDATIDKVAKICKEQGCDGGAGVELLLFPEAFISWYPRGNTFGVVIGSRTAEGREMFRKYWDSSVTVPGPATIRLGEIARANKLYLIIGVIEREELNGTLYCTILYFDKTGCLLGKHRKLMPTAGERIVWGFGDGGTLPVFDTEVGRVGGVICWENYMPMLRMAMYAKGVQLYLAPTAGIVMLRKLGVAPAIVTDTILYVVDCRETWVSSMRHIAVEGRCFVLTCNQFVKRSDYKIGVSDYHQDFPIGDDAVICSGGSCIINPYGEFLAGPNFEGETVLTAELDLNEIIRSKIDFDPVGHYSRPDVFSLVVNEKKNAPVTFINGSSEDDNKKKNDSTAIIEDKTGKMTI